MKYSQTIKFSTEYSILCPNDMHKMQHYFEPEHAAVELSHPLLMVPCTLSVGYCHLIHPRKISAVCMLAKPCIYSG